MKGSNFCKWKCYILVSIFMVAGDMLYAQDAPQYLPTFIELKDGDTLSAPGFVDVANDILQIQRDGLKTYSAAQLYMVRVHYPGQAYRKVYYVFPYSAISDYKKPKLFEMLFSGKYVSLMCREVLITEMTPVFDAFTHNTFFMPRQRISEEYYLMWEDGEKIRRYSGSKKELIVMLRDKQSELKRYIKENKLKLNRRADLIKIIEQYNKLKAGIK